MEIMRGIDTKQASMLCLVSLEDRVPRNHPLRAIHEDAMDAALAELSGDATGVCPAAPLKPPSWASGLLTWKELAQGEEVPKVIFRMLLLPSSATYTLHALSIATPRTPANSAMPFVPPVPSAYPDPLP